MNNCNLLIDFNKSKVLIVDRKNGKIIIRHKKKEFDNYSLQKIIFQLNYILEKFSGIRSKIIFNFEDIKFNDKLSFVGVFDI